MPTTCLSAASCSLLFSCSLSSGSDCTFFCFLPSVFHLFTRSSCLTTSCPRKLFAFSCIIFFPRTRTIIRMVALSLYESSNSICGSLPEASKVVCRALLFWIQWGWDINSIQLPKLFVLKVQLGQNYSLVLILLRQMTPLTGIKEKICVNSCIKTKRQEILRVKQGNQCL